MTSAITLDAKAIYIPATSSTQQNLASELHIEYQGLGDALLEMKTADDEDDWKINDQVYKYACYVAAGLMNIAAPAPKLFSHSPTSVVFDWTVGGESRYLTISANYLSLLVSTPTKIERRDEYQWNAILKGGFTAGLLADASKDGLAPYRLLTAETSPSGEFVTIKERFA
jgi:hypothetical protein